MLTGALRQLFAVAEAYPDLKANQNFLNLQEELTVDRGPHRVRAAVLQRQRAEVQQQDPDVPVEHHRRHVQLRRSASTSRAKTPRREVPQRPVLSTSPPMPTVLRVRTDRVQQAAQRAPDPRLRRCCVALVGRRRQLSCIGGGVVGFVDRGRRSRSRSSFVSYFNSDKVALAMSHAQAGRRAHVRPLPQPRRGALHRERAARSRGSYVVDDPAPNAFATGRNPQARGDRGHDRAAREDEPGRARRRARARAQPHQELRHPRDDARGHDGRDHRAALRLLPALHVLGRRPARQRRNGNNPLGVDLRALRRRAADLRADHRPRSCSSR